MPNYGKKIGEGMGNIRMDTHAAIAAQNDEMGDAFKDSHAAVAAQNDSFGEWAQNDKTGYIPNTTHTEELFPSCHTEEFSLFCHTEERSDVSIHNSKCHIFSFCAFSLLSIITLSFSAPAQAQGLQFVYIFKGIEMPEGAVKPPKCVKANPAECVWEISGKFDSRGCPEIQYCKDIDRDKVICLNGHCVECITNADCLITEPICQNNVCVPCPDGMKYDKEKKECVCPASAEMVCNESALTYDTNGCPLNKYEACVDPKTVCDTDNKTCICPTCSDPNNMIQDANCNCTCDTTKGFESSPVNGQCVCANGSQPNANGYCCNEPTELVYNESALTYDTNGCPLNKYEVCTDGKICGSDNKNCEALRCARFGLGDGLYKPGVWGDKCNRYGVAYTDLTPHVIYHGHLHGDSKTCPSNMSGYFCFLTDKTASGKFAKHKANSNSTATLDGKNMLQDNTWSFKGGECYSYKSYAGAKGTPSMIEVDGVSIGADLFCH